MKTQRTISPVATVKIPHPPSRSLPQKHAKNETDTVGKEIIDLVSNQLRRTVDRCDNVQGFVVTHSIGGGTGSGLGALILERLAVDYRKKSKLAWSVYPSVHLSTSIVEPYNALLGTHWMLDHTGERVQFTRVLPVRAPCTGSAYLVRVQIVAHASCHKTNFSKLPLSPW